jgi:type IV fimbrial biogenesis protein FimT
VKHNRAGRPTHCTAQAGLSVIELLIILAVLAVIVLVTVPGSAMLLQSYRLKSASSDLVSGLNLARTEAIRRASTVRVCPSSNGRFCRDDGRWSDGWLVYSDGNGDGAVQEIELLQSYTAPDTHVHIIARGAAQKYAAFTLSGLVRENGSKDAEFILCHDGSDADSRTVIIDADGWVSLVNDPNPACTSEQPITG